MGCTARSEMKVSCNFHMLINPYVNQTFKYAFYKKGMHWLFFFRSYLGTLALNTNALNISIIQVENNIIINNQKILIGHYNYQAHVEIALNSSMKMK